MDDALTPLEIISVTHEGGFNTLTSYTITFTSSPGQVYVIERSRDLLVWEPLWQGNVTVADGLSAFTDAEPILDGNIVFYRVRKEE